MLTRDSKGRFQTLDSGQRASFSGGMVRDVATDKILWDTVFEGPMLRRWAELMTRGAKKYEKNNWLKANDIVAYERFRESAVRHFVQWFYQVEDGEDHAAACFFNISGVEYVLSRVKVKE